VRHNYPKTAIRSIQNYLEVIEVEANDLKAFLLYCMILNTQIPPINQSEELRRIYKAIKKFVIQISPYA